MTNRATHKPASCCQESAAYEEAVFCGECAKTIHRCMSFKDCGGVRDDYGLCNICVDPRLQIDAGAVIATQIGAGVALPISIANTSPINRPLYVKALWSREGNGAWRQEKLEWLRLDQGTVKPATITIDELSRAGSQEIKIRIAVSTRQNWREESFVFSTGFTIMIASEKQGPVTNIKVDGTGHALMYNGDKRADDPEHKLMAYDLALNRMELAELELGYRGLDTDTIIHHTAEFLWQGFAPSDICDNGPIITPDGILEVGRDQLRSNGGGGDIRLLAEDQDGQVDMPTSGLMSRRHFKLYIECDRLMLRVTGRNGLAVNGTDYPNEETIRLKHGDTISPIRKYPEALSIQVKFEKEHNEVKRVIMRRTPVSRRDMDL